MEGFQSFYFDCDSTLSSIEGVDELTQILPPAQQAELAALTHQAMEGAIPLARIYEERLSQVAPSSADLTRVGELYIENTVPDCAATIAALQFLGKQVGIISGGLHQPVLILAKHLNIPANNVHAVPVLFDAAGNYSNFDHQSPLWQNGGKIEILAEIPSSHRPVLFMGDGATDLETQAHVDLFVGYGGIERRSAVEAGADVYLTEASLAGVLAIGLTPAEKSTLQSHPTFGALLPSP